MEDDEIIEAVYNAAFNYITSVVPNRLIEDLDIVVTLEDKDILIDIMLVSGRPEELDKRTVEEALKIASEKADELMGKK
jgi:hypothetical protein